MQDLKLAFRQLAKSPGFTALALAALAFGLGANVVIFSTINTVLLRPLSYPEPARLVRVYASFPDRGLEQANVSYLRYVALRDQQEVFSGVSAQAFTAFTLTGRGDPEQLQAQRVTANFFPTLGIRPLLGRVFTADEDRPGGAPVVLLSHAIWQKRFGADPSILGQSLTLNGVPQTVIGILPPRLGFPFDQTQAWTARVFDLEGLSPDLVNRGTGYLLVQGRLKPGVSLAQAADQIKVIAGRYAAAFPDKVDTKAGFYPVLLHEDLVRNSRPALLVLLAAVGFVLLIACANVANLLLARFTARRKEIAVCLALGATRGRIVRQFLIESVLTAALAGFLGVLLAYWGLDGLVRITADFLPRARELSIDGPVLAYGIALTLLTGVLLGFVPALQASRPEVGEALKEANRGTAGGPVASRFRSLLLVGEVAISLVLLVGAGLLVGSFLQLQRVRAGFEPGRVATFNLGISPGQYATVARQTAFYEQLLERLLRLPGVDRAAAAASLPAVADGFTQSPFALEGESTPPINERAIAVRSTITPGFFGALGIPVTRGRDFTWRDREGAPDAVIINETMAKRLFPHGENPLGRRLITGIQSIPREIVGVVGDVRSRGLAEAPQDEMYYPTAQLGDLFMSIVVVSDRPAASLAREIQTAVHAIDSGVPVAEVRPYLAQLADSISDRRLTMILIGAFAGLALLLAGLGIYSVIAYSVTRRTGEFGVRMALGAAPGGIIRLVLHEGLRLTAWGLGLGFVASLALTRLLHSLLFEISATDPVVYGGVALFLVAVAALACWLPARRAAKVDPMVALRAE